MNLVVSHWSANLLALAGCAAAAAVHLRGVRGIRADARRRGEALPGGLAREAAIFQAGLLVVVLALASPVGYWSHRQIWVRSLQDLLLANVAPALIVLGAPWAALGRGLRPRPSAAGTGPPPHGRARPPAGAWPAASLLAAAAFCAAWCAWHLPVLYDAALAHPAVYAAEVVTYLGLGIAFWLQIVGSRPLAPRLTPLRRMMVLTGTVVVGTVLAMALVFGSHVVYTAYLGGHDAAEVLAGQQLGGGVLWVLMLPSYTIAAVALLVRWLNDEESHAMADGLNRLLRPARPAWPSRPVGNRQ